MPGTAKMMTVCTVAGLVMVSAYSAAMGGSPLLWFVWIVLALVTLGVVVTRKG
ncbi:hypothetical protein [Streptomyces sp. AJS327]|uniref:hypothetical protein n=1 Tax=Streptomyces sp. AJS327 TaxID=2545265 RepID=UPI0015DFCC6E|nr:hypothetical protein [Streptomyces sp. AJS327]